MTQIHILFVCLGNICRSSMAEGILRSLAEQTSTGNNYIIDSAGTGAWHVGCAPDGRAQSTARARGIDISSQRARQINRRDFERFDHILAMDHSNFSELIDKAPVNYANKVRLFLDYLPGHHIRDVPDPYYGGPEGFEEAFDLIEQACKAFLKELSEDIR